MDLFRSFNRLLEDAVSSRTVATFGNGAVQLFGPVQLNITPCGVSVEHPFYLVDDRAASLSPALLMHLSCLSKGRTCRWLMLLREIVIVRSVKMLLCPRRRL